ncbi:hypothetical protein JOJ86_007425 [Rhodococcus percolatus]|uniref:hypothetical protein n=1 Tax=Rhodococcus opacus TaxID=37919 RepID=UPI0015FD8F41|nr:hypothetical protein [Rhodococcus opacus]MBA8965059.1 hypothetical protein [Rhodococcus opacus]MBP2209632.1 hypothetical protein [Rhodococcus opacus]
MKVLGVNGASSKLYLGVVGDNGPELVDPPALEVGTGGEGGLSLIALRSECDHALARIAPDLVVILDPESNAKLTWKAAMPRLSAETVLVCAATAAGIPVERVTRPFVRSACSFGRSGSLASHAKDRYPDPVGPYWAGKRDLAALAAVSRHGDA